MRKRNRAAKLLRLNLISLAVASCFSADLAFANPTGPVVANGQVSIIQNGNLLQITNSPSSIINWQSFSIGASEITRFLQQSNSSAVLNRVVTQNPSSILGALQSNGRVFLINPNGILFGAGAQIDVAGLVASSLNLSDTDFLAGRLRFSEVPGAGSVINQGAINTAQGGQVYLVGPAVTNSGVITSPKGEVILAAGNSVELVDPGTPNLRVEITAPDNQALNLGQIIADSGRVGIYAGLINQNGVVQANTAVLTEDGRIVLKATGNANLNPGSVTMTSGPLEIEAGEILVAGSVTSGPQTINAGGGLVVQSTPGNFAQLTSSGGQTINAGFVEVTAQGAPATISNNFSGDQLITTSGMNASGEGLALRNFGGGATIGQNVAGGQQVINVNNAHRVTIDGVGGNALIFDNSGVQTLTISGTGANALRLGSAGSLGASQIGGGGIQTITAGLAGEAGSITIHGKAAGSGGNSIIVSNPVPGGTQTVSTPGTLTVIGGTASTGSEAAGVFANGIGGQQTINAGAIVLHGGDSGNGNNATIGANNGTQEITVGAGGIGLMGGTGGSNNNAIVNGATQTINTTGGVTLVGGSGIGSNARLGGRGGATPGATELVLSAGGDVVLTGGSAADTTAILGNAGTVPQPTQITIKAGGDVILNAGPASGARIGANPSASAAGGDISISAAGDIQLNGTTQVTRIRTPLGNVTLQAGTTISEGPNGRIEASALTTTSIGSTSLTGPNQVALFDALSVAGDVALNNTSPLLTVTGINQSPLADLTINQAGNLTLTGTISSGPQTISATGNILVVPSSPAIVSSSGDQTITAGGALTVQGGASGTGESAQILASGDQTISASSIAVTGGSGTNNFAEILQNSATGSQSIEAGSITITGGSGGPNNFARIRNDGPGAQTITGSPVITITGGTGGLLDQGNFAQIRAAGPQIISAGATTLTAGASGFNNFATIQSPNQDITVDGNLTLTGGGSISGLASGAAARIGGFGGGIPTPTNLTLTVDGNVTMNGGTEVNAGAVIGSNFTGGQRTDITMDVTGDVTLNTGTVANSSARIGSPNTNIAGGDISITAGGNITLANSPVVGTRSVIRTLDSLTLDANNITVGGSLISGAQTITAAGGITVAAPNAVNALVSATGPQHITAGGALTVQGGAGAGLSASITGSGGQTIDASSITITGGSEGSNSFAEVLNLNGAQTITGAPAITLTGGDTGTNNFARIRNDGMGAQTITAGDTLLTAGAGGVTNFAVIQSRTQAITVHGDLTLTGGGTSPTATSDAGARIGGLGAITPTNLVLHVDGDVTLNGGSASGATIGANLFGGQRTDITMTVGGDVTLNAGAAGARIGSPAVNVAGGNISITSTGGNIVLNNTEPGLGASIRTLDNVTLSAIGIDKGIIEGADSVIQANQLTTTSNAGTSLMGRNEVAGFNATNAAAGNIAFNNSGNLALMASNTAPGGKITVNNLSGDLSTSGLVAASGSGSADVALATGGAVNIAHPVTATGTGDVTLAGGAITVDDTSVVAGGSVTVNATSLDVKGVSSGALIQVGDGFNTNLSGDLRVRSASVGGGFGGWAAILASHGPVNISAGSVALEGGKNLAGFAAITGGPIVATTTGDFSIAGGSGLGSFGMLLSNRNIDLTVGGRLRLNSGTGFGSFARIQTLYPGSTISLHFPELESGGYFVNGVEGRISQGLTGFFTGAWPATLGKTLITTYGEE